MDMFDLLGWSLGSISHRLSAWPTMRGNMQGNAHNRLMPQVYNAVWAACRTGAQQAFKRSRLKPKTLQKKELYGFEMHTLLLPILTSR